MRGRHAPPAALRGARPALRRQSCSSLLLPSVRAEDMRDMTRFDPLATRVVDVTADLLVVCHCFVSPLTTGDQLPEWFRGLRVRALWHAYSRARGLWADFKHD